MTSRAEAGQIVRLGLVASDVERAVGDWQSFIDLVNDTLPSDIGPISLRVFNSHSGLLWAVWDGEIDAFIDEPVLALNAGSEAHANPLATLNWPHFAMDSACLVTLKSNKLERLEELTNQKIAFDKASSTFGYALPILMLHRAGIDVVEDGNQPEAFLEESVRFHFTKDNLSPIFWLYRGKADIAAVTQSQLKWIEANRLNLIKVLACSQELPHSLLMVVNNSPVKPALRLAFRALEKNIAATRIQLITKEEDLPEDIRLARELLSDG